MCVFPTYVRYLHVGIRVLLATECMCVFVLRVGCHVNVSVCVFVCVFMCLFTEAGLRCAMRGIMEKETADALEP